LAFKKTTPATYITTYKNGTKGANKHNVVNEIAVAV
jgi:hypothetical protein